MEHSALFFLLVATAIFLTGFTKGGFGGAGGALATPLLVLVLPANRALGLMLPILIAADALALASHWRGWDWRLVARLIPAAIAGVALATVFITRVSPTGLRRSIGVVVLIFAVYKVFEPRLLRGEWYHPRGWHAVLAGGVAGVTSAMAHTGGPPIAIFLLFQKLTPRKFVGTSVLFFTLLNWVKLPTYFFAGLFDLSLLRPALWLLPLLPASVWVGKKFAVRVNRAAFERAVVGLLALAAVLLLME